MPRTFLEPVWPSMTQPTENPIAFPDVDMVKTCRHLRFMRALFAIDDPELERALAVVLDRLAKAGAAVDGSFQPAPASAESKSSQD
jgi:hypothetical protein